MMELKPCKKCGKNLIFVSDYRKGVLYRCMVGCAAAHCISPFIVCYGFTRKHAVNKAVKLWNKEQESDMKRCPKCKAKVKPDYNGYKCCRCGWRQDEPLPKRLIDWMRMEWWT